MKRDQNWNGERKMPKKEKNLICSHLHFPELGKYLFLRRFKISLELIPDFPRLPAFRDRPPTPPSRAQEALFSAKAEVTTSAQVKTQENPFLEQFCKKYRNRFGKNFTFCLRQFNMFVD